ncbi:hypothetical protein BT96DRAFT_948743 [Gymnopus androsaceus JB14]|uniref:Uncharacterized protein n=1 Tax=Gymnopus androsaceus JB14 TaxID=1447944 RepID=A0A6A4GMF0_9AGAR|nr:hypothetical protein BT96DRAFT_948743 [Gymnopus androsaceus JB14]
MTFPHSMFASRSTRASTEVVLLLAQQPRLLNPTNCPLPRTSQRPSSPAKDKNIRTGKPPTDIRRDLKVHKSRMICDLLWQGLGSDLTWGLARQQKDRKLDFFEPAHKNKARVTMHATSTTVAPRDTTTQRQYVPQYVPYEYRPYQASLATTATAPVAAAAPVPFTMPTPSTSTAIPAPPPASHNGRLVATGDWSRDLVHLTKTAELQCSNLCTQILSLSEGDYASAKADMDCLCVELCHPPLPSLQSMSDEKAAGYLNEHYLNGNSNPTSGPSAAATPASTHPTAPVSTPTTTTTAIIHPPGLAVKVAEDYIFLRLFLIIIIYYYGLFLFMTLEVDHKINIGSAEGSNPQAANILLGLSTVPGQIRKESGPSVSSRRMVIDNDLIVTVRFISVDKYAR